MKKEIKAKIIGNIILLLVVLVTGFLSLLVVKGIEYTKEGTQNCIEELNRLKGE